MSSVFRLDQLSPWSRYDVTLAAQGMGIIAYSNGSDVITVITQEVGKSLRP